MKLKSSRRRKSLENQKAVRSLRSRLLGTFEILELRYLLSADSINGRPYIDLGPSDNIAIQQPVITVQLIKENDVIVGPNTNSLDTFLLDTGANTILAFKSVVDDMPLYKTDGRFEELGVGGSSLYDISVPYQFDYAGESGVRNTLPNARIISDATRDLSDFGPYGIVGMPAMTNKVTTLDFTSQLTDFTIHVDFSATLPTTSQPRYSIPVDNRVSFSPEGSVISGSPPAWANLPFLTGQLKQDSTVATGNFLFDTGAQVSILSTAMAKELGLDSNQDGVLDSRDASYARNETIAGIGGLVTVPVFLIDQLHLPTSQGTDLVLTDLQWLVFDITPGIDAVLGFDNNMSGWLEPIFAKLFGQPDLGSGYIMQTQLDFRNWNATGRGNIHFDLNPDIVSVVDPNGAGAIVSESGGLTTVAEGGANDTYTIALSLAPTANVRVSLVPGLGQVTAVSNLNPANAFLDFTPSNWNVPQTVKVTAVDDGDVEQTLHRSFVKHTSTSTDPRYQNVGMPRVIVNIIDNDSPGMMILPSNGSTDVVEGGAGDTYQLVLTYPPTQPVTIDFENNQHQVNAVATIGGASSITFTAANWNIPQSVSVTAVDDTIVEGPHKTYISHVIVSTDPNYGGLFALQETVFITDNDAPTPPTLTTLSPSDNATAVPVAANLVVTFNQAVKKGNGFVHVVRASDGKSAQDIDIQSNAVSISGAVVTINPTADLAGLTNYFIAFDDGAILNNTSFVRVGSTLLSQDFELMTLGPAVTETVGLTANGRDFVSTPPAGYVVDRSQMPPGGVPEWSGWTFADKSFWQTEGGQARSNFTKGQGTFAVGDTQEWDDLPQLNNNFNSLFTTSPISLANVIANTVVLEFDSSFRPEGSVAANNQVGALSVSYDGGTNWSNLFTYDFNNTGSAATAANINEHKVVTVPNPAPSSTGSMKFRYGLTGTNDGWWAIDNIKVTGNTTGLTYVGIAKTDATTWNFTTAEALTLSLTVPATPISEKGGISTVTVSRNLGTTGNVIVNLTSSDITLATVPATVTIPAGQASIIFAVTAVDDPYADGLKNATITATSNGFVNGSGIVPIADNEIGNVAITEIMYNPAGIEGKTEWIELYNRGSITLDLSGWSFDDEDTTNWGAIPAGTLLDPGKFAVVYNSFFGSISETTFRTEWNVPSDAVVVGVFWGDLDNSPSAVAGSINENIAFKDAGKVSFDQVNYDDDGTIWPAAANGPSIYLSRVFDNNDDGTKWKSSVVGTNNAVNPTNPAGATYSVADVGSPGRGPTVSNTAYYKGSSYTSGGTNIDGGFDPSKRVAKAGASAQTLSFENVSNYIRGINGLVTDVVGLTATSMTVADFGFRMSPQGAFDEAVNPPNSWAAAPAPTAIVVTAATATTPARVRFEWDDNVIQNRWLEVRVLANAAIGITTVQEFYLGHLQGEINGVLLGGSFFVQNADLTAGLPVGGVGSPGSVTSIRDVDKNGLILNSDFIAIRQGIVGGLALRNITIPAAGSGAALPRGAFGAPPVQSFDPASMIPSSPQKSIQATKLLDLDSIVDGNSLLLRCLADATSGTTTNLNAPKVLDISKDEEKKDSRVERVDDFFADLDRRVQSVRLRQTTSTRVRS